MNARPTVSENNHHAAQRIRQREENQRHERLREAKRRDIDADLPLYTWQLLKGRDE